MPARLVAIALLLGSISLRAQAEPKPPVAARPQKSAPPVAAQPPKSAPPDAAQPPKSAPPDDLDLLPPEEKIDAAGLARASELERQLRERRTLLRVHQVTGLSLLVAMGATTVLGQLDYSDKYGGGGDTGKWLLAHRVASYGTAGIFTAAGLLALFAPTPFERGTHLDTATLHKTCMAVATAGMIAQVALGIATAHSEGRLDQRDLALAHQLIGYTTLAATTAGFLMLTF